MKGRSAMDRKPKADLAAVPEYARKRLFLTLHASIDAFYEDPKNEEAFRKWLRQRSERKVVVG